MQHGNNSSQSNPIQLLQITQKIGCFILNYWFIYSIVIKLDNYNDNFTFHNHSNWKMKPKIGSFIQNYQFSDSILIKFDNCNDNFKVIETAKQVENATKIQSKTKSHRFKLPKN